jgi:transposase-like protein
MAFTALFLAREPDADYEKHNNVINTGKCKLFTFVVKNQSEAIEVSKSIYQKVKIDSIILCPGFTHNDVSEIF